MKELKEFITNEFPKFLKINVFVLFIGLVGSRILGEENFNKFVGENANGIWIWLGSYGLGMVVLFVSIMINNFYRKLSGEEEK